MTNREKIIHMYLDWQNNWAFYEDVFLVSAFAEHHGMSEEKAHRVINTGRALNQRRPTLKEHWARLRRYYPAIERAK